jgi:4-hydroxybenzoate polyprenyltransferase
MDSTVLTGNGLTIFGLALIGAALFAHHKKQKWYGFAVAILAGLVLVISSLSGWLASRGPLVSVLAFVAFVTAIPALVKDLKDRRPDRVAMIAVAVMPMLLFASVAAIPMVGDSAKTGFNKTVQVLSDQIAKVG